MTKMQPEPEPEPEAELQLDEGTQVRLVGLKGPDSNPHKSTQLNGKTGKVVEKKVRDITAARTCLYTVRLDEGNGTVQDLQLAQLQPIG